jgi:hypothetical protein
MSAPDIRLPDRRVFVNGLTVGVSYAGKHRGTVTITPEDAVKLALELVRSAVRAEQ